MSLKSIKKCDVEPVYLAGFKVIHIVYQGIFTCFYCLLNLYKNYNNSGEINILFYYTYLNVYFKYNNYSSKFNFYN